MSQRSQVISNALAFRRWRFKRALAEAPFAPTAHVSRRYEDGCVARVERSIRAGHQCCTNCLVDCRQLAFARTRVDKDPKRWRRRWRRSAMAMVVADITITAAWNRWIGGWMRVRRWYRTVAEVLLNLPRLLFYGAPINAGFLQPSCQHLLLTFQVMHFHNVKVWLHRRVGIETCTPI